MALRIGQVLRGAKGSYELLRPLKGSTVFKAKVLSQANKPEWAVVKTAATEIGKICLRREWGNYQIKEIATSPYFRRLHDTIYLEKERKDPSCLVFEWMDHDMRGVYVQEFRSDPKLPRIVSKAVLSALDVLRTLQAVHTDIKQENVFISDFNGSSPTVKVGDLGNCILDGSATTRTQCLEARAPEVWRGLPCSHASDVWSLAVMLTEKLSWVSFFGPSSRAYAMGSVEAWCIATIMRVVGPFGPPVNQAYNEEFAIAEQLTTMEYPNGIMVINCPHWREALEAISDPPVPRDLLGFLQTLLAIDPDKRATASKSLLHPYLQNAFDPTITKWQYTPYVPKRGDLVAERNGTGYR